MPAGSGDGWIRTGRALVVVGVLLGVAFAAPVGAVPLVIDFESLAPRNPQAGSYPEGESYWDPNPGFTFADAFFSGGSFNGFVVSSSTTSGAGSSYLFFGSAAEISAQSNGGAGGGAGGSTNFAVGYGDGSFIDVPAGYRPTGASLTNTATAYEAILHGLFQASAFTAGDWFRVRFTGYSAAGGTGSQTGAPVDFYLADYRDGKSLVVDSWTALDLSPLGEARSIMLSFTSTDSDATYGINTPAYVAMDNVTFVPVPEPGTMALVAAGAGGCLLRRRRRRAGRVTG